MIELLHIDCMEYMARLPDKAFDLAIVDPPYGIGESKKKRGNFYIRQKNGNKLRMAENIYTPKNWDNKPAGKEYFFKLINKSKTQIIFGANYFDFEMLGFNNTQTPRRNEYDIFLKNRPYGYIIWDKMNGLNDLTTVK